MTDTVTTGRYWATEEFGLDLHHVSSSAGDLVTELVEPGLRRNPRRAHLLVSTVLGKHIPTDPAAVIGAGERLGALVADLLGDQASDAVVLGFAETATGLGHCVAESISAACYLHSTRRHVPGIDVFARFEEGHSHATSHLLLPTSGTLFANPAPLVLVDDEISTGATAADAIRALHEHHPRTHYVIASLVDMRSDEHRHTEDLAAELDVRIDRVSLARGHATIPTGLTERVTALDAPTLNPTGERHGDARFVTAPWPAHVPDGGRHGYLHSDSADFDTAIDVLADTVAGLRGTTRPAVVVGHEELMYLPLRLAHALSARGTATLFQTTTRSPAYVADVDGYPLRRGFSFTAPEHIAGHLEDEVPRYLYNAQWPDRTVDAELILVVDSPADTDRLRAPGGVVDVLTSAGQDVLVVTVPATDPVTLRATRTAAKTPLTGPDFGSYRADEVTWLLEDLSHVDLEGDITEREARIQAGLAHYAESLPIEYQPDAAYRDLFDKALASTAGRLAHAVGTVTELLLAERGPDMTLVSLARAGTPVGILVRRWAQHHHGITLPHYAVSIVRGRGIDSAALDYITERHDPASVTFIDGWTGKGAIARELSAALAEYTAAGGPALSDDLAVLADPGHCVRTYGTRDDFLIASACLNSTVSGLISRTVLNDTWIGPGDFHGAKFYSHLADDDVSNHLLDTVSAEFDNCASAFDDARALLEADRTPTWAGWESVERIRVRYGISSINFVKPGVGETTRVLLRRVPWKVLVRDITADEHAHIRMLAAARGVPVEEIPDLAYSCMGLIKDLP